MSIPFLKTKIKFYNCKNEVYEMNSNLQGTKRKRTEKKYHRDDQPAKIYFLNPRTLELKSDSQE